VNARIHPEAFVAAIGFGDDGHRRFPGFVCASTESHATWRSFLQDFADRGATNIRCPPGLRKALEEVKAKARVIMMVALDSCMKAA
jgi:transposase-like protein